MEEAMRDEDASYGWKPTVDELRDIHRRIDNLERESNRQFTSVTEKLNQIAVEQAVLKEKRPPFPMWAAGLLALGISQIGVQIWLNADLSNTVKDIPKVEAKCESNAAKIELIRETQLNVLNRLSSVEERAKEGTDDRWRKSDDRIEMQNLNRYLDEKFTSIETRLLQIEKKR